MKIMGRLQKRDEISGSDDEYDSEESMSYTDSDDSGNSEFTSGDDSDASQSQSNS